MSYGCGWYNSVSSDAYTENSYTSSGQVAFPLRVYASSLSFLPCLYRPASSRARFTKPLLASSSLAPCRSSASAFILQSFPSCFHSLSFLQFSDLFPSGLHLSDFHWYFLLFFLWSLHSPLLRSWSSLQHAIMSLAPYYYRPLTPPDAAAGQLARGHVRNVSNASSSYYTNDTSPESVMTHNTTPSRSPILRQNGPTLLPKIRTQDSCLDPSSAAAARTKNAHRRALSTASNPPASTRPPMYRSATEPVECTNMISPVSNAPYSRASSVNPSPGLTNATLHRTMKTHSRSGSASSIDTSILNRFGYPTYRQMPVYVAQQQQTPSPTLYPQTYLPYHNIPMLDPPLINLEGTFDMPIDLETISRPTSLSPPPPQPILSGPSLDSSSLITYLTQPTQPINLVRHLTSQPGRGMTSHFWWDVRNVRPWTSFSLSNFSTIPDLMTLLNFQHDITSLPNYTAVAGSLQTITPANESDLTNLITKVHFPRANAAALLSLGGPNSIALYPCPPPTHTSNTNTNQSSTTSNTNSSSSHPTFLANYPSDNDRTLSGLPRGRIVGLSKSFDKWNTGMRREGPARKVEYLKGLAHLQKCMRDHSCRYGFIVTEIELVCVRAGCDDRGNPYFGYVEVADAIATKTSFQFDHPHHHPSSPCSSGGLIDEVPMTATLALYFMLMLAKATPLPGQPRSFMDVGGPGALTRQRVWDGRDVAEDQQGKEGRDRWIPEPQVGEKREARTVRGWVWPADPWHKREGGGGKRRG